MNKIKGLIIIVCVVVLCACLSPEPNKAVCTLKEKHSNVTLSLYYDRDEVVESIEYVYTQKFSEDMIKGLNEVEIIKMLESIFKKDGSTHVNVDVDFNKRTRIGMITITCDMEDLSDEEVLYYKLKRDISVDEVRRKVTKIGYSCKE